MAAVSHRVSFKGGVDFEMHYMTFELSDEDLSDEVKVLPVKERLWHMQQLLIAQGLVFQLSKSHIQITVFKAQLDYIKTFFDKLLRRQEDAT